MILDKEQTYKALPWKDLIDAIDKVFTEKVISPTRHHHTMKVPGDMDASLLLMPAWIEGRFSGVKIVNVFPGNNKRGLVGLTGHYFLSCFSLMEVNLLQGVQLQHQHWRLDIYPERIVKQCLWLVQDVWLVI